MKLSRSKNLKGKKRRCLREAVRVIFDFARKEDGVCVRRLSRRLPSREVNYS